MKKLITLLSLLFVVGAMAGEPCKKDCKKKCCVKSLPTKVFDSIPGKDFFAKEREWFKTDAKKRIFNPGETSLQLFTTSQFDKDEKDSKRTWDEEEYEHTHGDNKPGKGHHKGKGKGHKKHEDTHTHHGISYEETFYNTHGDEWGGGIGITHFQTLNWGYIARTTALDNDGTFVEDAAAGLVYRIPVEQYRIAPYAKVDGGYSFNEDHSLVSVRGGFEFRPKASGRWSLFAEGGYQWAEQQYPVFSTGLSVLLGK